MNISNLQLTIAQADISITINILLGYVAAVERDIFRLRGKQERIFIVAKIPVEANKSQ
jgi:ABC-type sulfate transport system permease subunit